MAKELPDVSEFKDLTELALILDAVKQHLKANKWKAAKVWVEDSNRVSITNSTAWPMAYVTYLTRDDASRLVAELRKFVKTSFNVNSKAI